MVDCINLPMRTLHSLYVLAFNRSKTDAERLAEEELRDNIEEGGIM